MNWNGNSGMPRFTNRDRNIRPQDSKLSTDRRKGIVYVLPSHAGVSANEVFDEGKNRWKIKANTPIPSGLAIAVDLITPGMFISSLQEE